MPNRSECAPRVRLKLSANWNRCSLGYTRGYACAAPTVVPATVKYSGPVSGGHRSDAAGSANRSLNQPKRNSLTELGVTTAVHNALPYRVSTIELPLLARALPFVSTA